jgi:hypothetical protein
MRKPGKSKKKIHIKSLTDSLLRHEAGLPQFILAGFPAISYFAI